MISPRCPYCNAQGVKHIAAKQLGHFSLIFCGQCGAIYGVVPAPASGKQAPVEKPVAAPAAAPPEAVPPPVLPPLKPVPPCPEPDGIDPANWQGILERFGNADLPRLNGPTPRQIQMEMKAVFARSGTRYRHIVIDDGPPMCLHHWIEMKKITVPRGYKNTALQLWVCPRHLECRRWAMVEK